MGLTRIRAEQISDIDYKQAVRVISTSNVTLTGGAPSQVDGVNLNVNDRILVAGQSTPSQNGLYDVTVVGTGSDGTWVRTSDANATGEINAGMIVMVTEGNTYADTSWKLITDDPISIGVTALTFLQNTGNSFSIINVVGSANVVANGVSSTVAFTSGNNFSITGNATADTITFDVSQSPSFTGNVYGGNLLTAGLLSATGNVTTGNYFIGNGAFLTGIVTSAGAAIVNGNSNVSVGANANVTVGVSGVGNVVVWAPTGEYVTGVVSATGNIYGNAFITSGSGGGISASGNIQGGNLLTTGYVSATGNIIGNLISATGNVDAAGNILADGYASVSGNVIGGNITTVGLISATGNAQAGNILTAGLISSTGNATAGNILTAGLISSTGNATAGNILTAGFVSATGNVTGNYILGNGSQLTGIITSVSNVVNGNSNLNIGSANANVTISVSTVGNVAVFTPTGVSVLGTIAANGNVSGGNILTAGLISATSTITSAANISGGNISTAGLISATGNVYGNAFITSGSGGGISASGNIQGGNLLTAGYVSASGNIIGGNINTAGAITATGNVYTGNIINAGSSSSTGNITGGNVLTAGLISATSTITSAANITGGNITTAGLISATGNAQVGNVATAGVVTATGNVTAGNILTGGLASITGNITTAGNVNTANIYGASGVTIATGGNNSINLYPGGTGNIVLPSGNATYINNLPLNPVQDNDAASKYYVDTLASTGIAYHTPVYVATTANLATTTGGTITYAQPNGAGNGVGATITTTGSFNLIDTGNVQIVGTRILVKTEGNAVLNGIYTWSNATAIVRSTDADEYGADSANALSINDYFFVTSGNVNAGSSFIVNSPTGTITFGTSNITFAQFSTSQTYTSGNGISIAGTVINARVDNVTTAFDLGGNISVKASANLTTPNIGAATGTSLSATGALQSGTTIIATGNVTGGNITTVGLISATGNITGNYFIGNGSQLTGIDANSIVGSYSNANVANYLPTFSGNLTAGNVSVSGNTISGNILTGGVISATSNVTGGNVLTSGIVSSSGNVYANSIISAGGSGGNITGANFVSANIFSATGNVYAGNVTATGNVQGNYILGNGALLTGVSTSSSNINNGNSNVTIASANANVTVSVSTIGNVAVFTPTGISVLGTIAANGNVSGGNITTAGLISAAGNVYGGNIVSGGGTGGNITGANIISANTFNAITVSASSNVIAGNILTAGLMSSTGNAIHGNILTAGLISATGNVTGNYFIGNGSQLTGITTSVSNVANGGSNLNISAANANVTISVSTVGNVAVFTPTGISVLGTVAANGNVSGGNILTAGLVSATSNITGGNILTAGLISATSTITSAANITGGNITTAGIITATGNVYANTFISTGSGGTLSGSGNIIGGNLLTGGNVSATGNVTGNYILGNGSQLTGIITSVSNVVNGGSNLNISAANANVTISVSTIGNVAVFAPTGISVLGTVAANGNVSGGNITTVGLISATGNITSSANIIQTGTGNINGYNGYFSNNLTVIGVFQSTSNIIANGAGIFYGNTNTGNSAIYGGVPGFTTLGSNVVVQFAGNANSYSQVNFQNINSGSLASTDLVLTANNGNDTAYFADFGITSNNHSDSAFFGDTSTINDTYLYAVATSQAGPSTTSGPGNLILGSTNGQIKLFVGNTAQANVIQQVSSIGIAVTGVVSATGNVTGNYFIGNGSQLTGIVVSGGAAITNGNSNVTVGANANVTVGVSGVGNVIVFAPDGEYVTGNISATGNITGNYIYGNGAFLTGISGGNGGGASNIIYSGQSNVNIAGANANITIDVSGVGNVVVITPDGLSATGNIYGNTFISSGSGGGISAPGNIVGGNLITAGNVTGNYFIGDGSQLTGVIATATNISNGLSNITIATANANVAISVSTVGNVAVFTPTTVNITGNISATGNIVAGGVRSTSSASAPSNPTTGDFWYDTSTNTQYRFTFDGTNYYWIDDFGATVTTQPLFTGPILFNDVSTQTNGKKGVFALKNNQANVAGIANSKQLQVTLNGAIQTPFVKTWVWPFWCVDVSFKGFKVTTLGYTSTANSVVLYRPPAKGTQVNITQVNTATDSQLVRYPFSATTIAISD